MLLIFKYFVDTISLLEPLLQHIVKSIHKISMDINIYVSVTILDIIKSNIATTLSLYITQFKTIEMCINTTGITLIFTLHIPFI